MNDFDLRKYLAEGKLLKEVMDEKMEDYVSAMYDSDVDQEAEEGFQSDVWSKAEYASNAYTEESVALFLELIDHLKSVGGTDVVEGNPDIKLELLRNGDIKWSADVTFTEDGEYEASLDRLRMRDDRMQENEIVEEDIEGISIDGEHMGEHEVYSGYEFEEFLEEMLELSLDEEDFINKVIVGITDETSSIAREDEMKLRQYYEDKFVGENISMEDGPEKIDYYVEEVLKLVTPYDKDGVTGVLDFLLNNPEEMPSDWDVDFVLNYGKEIQDQAYALEGGDELHPGNMGDEMSAPR